MRNVASTTHIEHILLLQCSSRRPLYDVSEIIQYEFIKCYICSSGWSMNLIYVGHIRGAEQQQQQQKTTFSFLHKLLAKARFSLKLFESTYKIVYCQMGTKATRKRNGSREEMGIKFKYRIIY